MKSAKTKTHILLIALSILCATVLLCFTGCGKKKLEKQATDSFHYQVYHRDVCGLVDYHSNSAEHQNIWHHIESDASFSFTVSVSKKLEEVYFAIQYFDEDGKETNKEQYREKITDEIRARGSHTVTKSETHSQSPNERKRKKFARAEFQEFGAVYRTSDTEQGQISYIIAGSCIAGAGLIGLVAYLIVKHCALAKRKK